METVRCSLMPNRYQGHWKCDNKSTKYQIKLPFHSQSTKDLGNRTSPTSPTLTTSHSVPPTINLDHRQIIAMRCGPPQGSGYMIQSQLRQKHNYHTDHAVCGSVMHPRNQQADSRWADAWDDRRTRL